MIEIFGKKQKNSRIAESTFECVRNGLTIRGTEYKPEGEMLPIAIVSHGFMAFQDTVRHYARALAENGYLSYCFDFCGGSVIKGKSDGKTTEMSVLTEVEDLEVVIKYAQSRPYADPNGILLMGCSQGGFVSALTAAKHGGLVSKLVLFYPALCIPDDARAGKMMFAEFDPEHIPPIVKCGPMKLGRCYVEDVIRMDPFAEIKPFRGDVLIVHGDKDNIVDIRYAKTAYEAYTEAVSDEGGSQKRSVVFKMIPNGTHGFSKKADQIAVKYLLEFLSR